LKITRTVAEFKVGAAASKWLGLQQSGRFEVNTMRRKTFDALVIGGGLVPAIVLLVAEGLLLDRPQSMHRAAPRSIVPPSRRGLRRR
jgi:hypothetical protein